MPPHPLRQVFRLFAFPTALILALAAFARANDTDGPPLPPDVTLSNGTVLHHISVVRWGKEQVTLKHDSGIDPISYSNMPDAERRAFESARDFNLAQDAKLRKRREAAGVVIHGQVFIQTVGDGPAILGSTKIFAFPTYALDAFNTYHDNVELPKPLATAISDADGLFDIKIPSSESFFVFAQASRFVGGKKNGGYEQYEWRIGSDSISEPDHLLLESNNATPPTPKHIVIAED